MGSMDVYKFDIDRDELGRRLGGGLAKGSITLIEGPDGSGKSVLSQRITYGLLQNGHTVTYISTELSTKDFINQMLSLKYNIIPFLLNRQLLFVPVFPPSVRKLKRKKDLVRRMMNAPYLFEREVTIIDSFTLMLDGGRLDKNTLFQFINFMKKIISQGKSIILTVDPRSTAIEVLEPLRDVADNYVITRSEIMADDIKNVLLVRRWKRTEREVAKVIKFRVEPKFGIIIDISSFAI